jgi:hypothetical protein
VGENIQIYLDFFEHVQNRFLNTWTHFELGFCSNFFEHKFDLNPLETTLYRTYYRYGYGISITHLKFPGVLLLPQVLLRWKRCERIRTHSRGWRTCFRIHHSLRLTSVFIIVHEASVFIIVLEWHLSPPVLAFFYEETNSLRHPLMWMFS